MSVKLTTMLAGVWRSACGNGSNGDRKSTKTMCEESNAFQNMCLKKCVRDAMSTALGTEMGFAPRVSSLQSFQDPTSATLGVHTVSSQLITRRVRYQPAVMYSRIS
jgi:hypothetical protein